MTAPRFRRLSAADGSLSLVQLLFVGAGTAAAPARGGRDHPAVVPLYVAAQFEAAGQAFAVTLACWLRPAS